MTILGKGFFITDLAACEGGDPVAILEAAQAAGLSRVIVRIADGTTPAGLDPEGNDSLVPFVQALKSGGIDVWGWQPVDGGNPQEEARSASQRIQVLGLDGFVVYAGSGYKKPGRERSARLYLDAIRDVVHVPVALSSYRFPQYHPEFPWAAFLEKCDYHMPQVFWELAHDAGGQLRESKRQCDALPNARPFVPVGAAYGPVGSWMPAQADLADFFGVLADLGIKAVNFFYWESCRSNLPVVWDTICAFRLPGEVRAGAKTGKEAATPADLPAPRAVQPASPAEPDDFARRFLAALNSRQPARVTALYASGATRVSAGQTLHGTSAIQADYANLFKNLPEGASFALVSVGIQGMVRTLAWQAGKLTGLTTLVVESGKITQDYTHLE